MGLLFDDDAEFVPALDDPDTFAKLPAPPGPILGKLCSWLQAAVTFALAAQRKRAAGL